MNVNAYVKRKMIWFDINVVVITVAEYTHTQTQEDAGKKKINPHFLLQSLNMAQADKRINNLVTS